MIKIVANTIDGIYKDSKIGKALVATREIQYPDSISNWWYLHGRLEERVGYDKGIIVSLDHLLSTSCTVDSVKKNIYYLPNGIYDIEIVDIDKPCKGYFWTTFEQYDNIVGKYPIMRGLVVFSDDEEANDYAYRKYIEKSSWL